MKKIRVSYWSLLLLVILSFQAYAQKKKQRVVVIGLDGLSTEGFKTARHPNLDQVIGEGVLSLTTRPVMPSVTLPNWTSHLTGSGPEEHGVVNNSWTLATHELKAIGTDKDGYYPSVFKLLKEKVPGVKTSFYYNWPELINSFNKSYIDEVSFEANDGYSDNYRKAFDFIVTNKEEPAFVFLYSVHTDHAGHQFKWMSPQYIKAIEEADVAIGKLLGQLREKDLYDDTHFLLITDHGGRPDGHGGVSMAEMQVPWAATGPKIRKTGLTELYNSNKNTALVIARIFGLKDWPKSWTGVAPKEIFK